MQKAKGEAVSKTQMLAWINRALNVTPPLLRSTKREYKTWGVEWSTVSYSITIILALSTLPKS
jgi:hypothetical protein